MSTIKQDRPVGDHISGYPEAWAADPGKTNYDDYTRHKEHAWGSSVYISRGEGFYESPARHEHYLAAKMQLRSGMRVLEVGCGEGGSAREIATFSGAHVVGVNNDERQVQRARSDTERARLQEQVEFVKGDIMDLVEQFGENSFDAVYAIEATCHAPSWEAIYGQIKKVLKPGGVFGVYEWCMTDAWDPSIAEHQELAHQLEIGNGILKLGVGTPEMRPLRYSRQAFINVGFKIEHEEDLAERPDALPWYYPLKGDYVKAQMPWELLTVLNTSWIGTPLAYTFRLFEMLGAAPTGTCETLKVTGNALVKGVETKLFTPMYFVIARKPLKEQETLIS